jgi:hypothetical protein
MRCSGGEADCPTNFGSSSHVHQYHGWVAGAAVGARGLLREFSRSQIGKGGAGCGGDAMCPRHRDTGVTLPREVRGVSSLQSVERRNNVPFPGIDGVRQACFCGKGSVSKMSCTDKEVMLNEYGQVEP